MSHPEQELRKLVASRITRLLSSDPSSKAKLAELRRGLGKKPGTLPKLWKLTLDGPSDWSPYPKDVVKLENALYSTLTLFALHQQSKSIPMHVAGKYDGDSNSMGFAAKKLALLTNGEIAVQRHMNALATAATMAEIVHHAKSLISQFKSKNIPLDYMRFAEDLYFLQNPKTRPKILLSWGRDYVQDNSSKEITKIEGV